MNEINDQCLFNLYDLTAYFNTKGIEEERKEDRTLKHFQPYPSLYQIATNKIDYVSFRLATILPKR